MSLDTDLFMGFGYFTDSIKTDLAIRYCLFGVEKNHSPFQHLFVRHLGAGKKQQSVLEWQM